MTANDNRQICIGAWFTHGINLGKRLPYGYRSHASLANAGCAASKHDVPGWRQWKHLQKSVKNLFNQVRRTRYASPMHIKAHLGCCKAHVRCVEAVLPELAAKRVPARKITEIRNFLAHAMRQINQIDRRLLKGETIQQNEKVFSIFEPHTRWISKGKAGCPLEFGVPVCIILN